MHLLKISGQRPWSTEFKEYVDERGYDLLTIGEYESLLKQSGFSNVRAEDRTELFEKYLLIELEKFRQIKDEFIREFSESDYNEIVDGWNEKIKRVAKGDQKWGVVYAEKI